LATVRLRLNKFVGWIWTSFQAGSYRLGVQGDVRGTWARF
jgi:hypothetical protein